MSHNAYPRSEAGGAATRADNLLSYSSFLVRIANRSCLDRKGSQDHNPLFGQKNRRMVRSNSTPDPAACETPDAAHAAPYRVNARSNPTVRLPEKQRLRGPADPGILCLIAAGDNHAAPILPPPQQRPPNNGPHSS